MKENKTNKKQPNLTPKVSILFFIRLFVFGVWRMEYYLVIKKNEILPFAAM